jgi:hypothetical protein
VSLEIGSALRYGFDRLFERNGLILVGVFVVVGMVGAVASQTVSQAAFDWAMQQPDFQEVMDQPGAAPALEDFDGNTLAVPGGFGVAAVLVLVSALASEASRVIADRTFVSDERETLYEPTRNLLPAVVFSFLAGIVAVVAVGLGLLFLIIPGIYIALALFFFRQEIAVFDKGPFDALVDSWSLTKGNRLELFLFGLALAVVAFLVNTAGGLAFGLLPSVVGTVAGVVVGAFVGAYLSAAAAGVYRQLLGMKRPDAEFALESMGTGQYGDIDEDWR